MRTPTYVSWIAMKGRCLNHSDPSWQSYGGRGIKVCDRWRNSFAAFLADMGKRPNGTSLDRFPNKKGNYEPGNCRWATPRQQQNNMQSNHVVTIGMQTMTLTEWAREKGLNPHLVTLRCLRGWDYTRALTTPPQKYGRRK